MASIVTTRRAIYELVWSNPMSKVAPDFGISDVALKKICDKHRVPSPPRGYWAKKEVGKAVKQVRFVETADPFHEKITIYGSRIADLPEPVREILQRARASRPARRVVSRTDPPAPPIPADQLHPIIARTANALRKHKPDKDGVVAAADNGSCGVDIGVASIERCITILDALARSLNAHGLTLVPAGNGMSVTTDGQTVAFRLNEYVRRDKHIPTAEDLVAEERRRKRMGMWDSPYGRAYPEWDFVRTGQLSIQIANRYAEGLRRTWKDGRHQRLENLIDDISVGIVAYGVALRLKEEEGARCERNYERRRRVEQRETDREKRERNRQTILDGLIAISVEASKLRTWLEEAKRWSGRSESDDFTRFVEWARNRLEHLDHAIDPDGIAESLRVRELFPENDPLIDPPEDLEEE
jgi:hypothetical protein